jgi:hypothetical protein
MATGAMIGGCCQDAAFPLTNENGTRKKPAAMDEEDSHEVDLPE